jgi:hypothetical protein
VRGFSVFPQPLVIAVSCPILFIYHPIYGIYHPTFRASTARRFTVNLQRA